MWPFYLVQTVKLVSGGVMTLCIKCKHFIAQDSRSCEHEVIEKLFEAFEAPYQTYIVDEYEVDMSYLGEKFFAPLCWAACDYFCPK